MKNSTFNNVIKRSLRLLIIGVIITTVSCKQNTRDENRTPQQPDIDTRSIEREVEPRAFTGEIRPVGNSGNNLSGEIGMRIEGDLMRFSVTAEGLAPDMMHMQYLLVSQTGDETQCPRSLEEVEKMGDENATATSGTILRRIPLHMAPATLQMDSDNYPRTNINGQLQFTHVISLDSLENAMRDKYQMQDLDFSKFTFIIKGVPDTQTSQRRPTGSNVKNLPVGCAKLQETAISN